MVYVADFKTDNYREHLQWKSLQGGFPFFLSHTVFRRPTAWLIPSYKASRHMRLPEPKELL